MSDLFKEGYTPPDLPENTAAFYSTLTDEMAIYTVVTDMVLVASRHALAHGNGQLSVSRVGMAAATALQQLGFHR